LYSHVVEDVLKFIETCAEIAWTVYTSARDHPPDSEQCLALQGRIEQAKVFVEKEMHRMKEFLTTLEHDRKFMTTNIEKQNAKYKYHIQQCSESLKMMLSALLGVETQCEGEGLATPPTLVVAEAASSSNAAGGSGGGEEQEEIVVVPAEKLKKTRGGKKITT
jgi:hypothetical protein